MAYNNFKTQSVVEDDHNLMCTAQECPNRWSVSSQMLCGAHAWAEPKNWAMITNAQLQAFAKRSAPRQPEPVEPMSMDEKMDAIANLSRLASVPTDYKLWAKKLKARETDGEILSNLQKKLWRGALNES